MKLKCLIACALCCFMSLGNSLVFAGEQIEEMKPIKLNPRDVERFSNVISIIKHLYVEEVTDKEMFSGAIQGMLKGLDPHSAYLDEKTYKDLLEHTKGKFVGLGIEVTQEKGIIKVISPIDDTPAEQAGLKPGDYILAADGKPLTDKPLDEAIRKMRGKQGTKITLTVINEKDKKPRKISIKRDVITIQDIKSKLLEGHYGYIRISHFQHKTGKKIPKVIKKLEDKAHGQLNGLIIDLRNNPGGVLESSAEVADAFLDSQQLKKNKFIVYTKGRMKASHFEKKASPGDILSNKPLIILINNGSASASEIVAGALQDHKRAIIMGQRTFGKGSVQTVLPISRKSAVKLTTALYYTPKGRSIQAKGIQPDIIVDNLKLKKPKEDALFFFSMRESNLKNHIANGSAKKNDLSLNHKQITELAISDYQLFEALKLLKSIHILQK